MKILSTASTGSLTDQPHRIRRAAKRGELRRLHRGGYLDLEGVDAKKLDPETEHAARTVAVARRSAGVVSGVSAANLHGLPMLAARLREPVMLTRGTRGTPAEGVRIRCSSLRAVEIVELHGMRVTSLERTIRDLAEYFEPHELLAVADAAMRQGFEPRRLPQKGRHSRIFRWLAQHASPRSESFAESWCRARIIEAGLPAPQLQVSIFDERGTFLGRVDLAWPELGLICEFDGRVKYGSLVGEREQAADVVMREKRRERSIGDLGWIFSRTVWSAVEHETALATQLEGDAARAARLPVPRGRWSIDPLEFAPPRDWSKVLGLAAGPAAR